MADGELEEMARAAADPHGCGAATASPRPATTEGRWQLLVRQCWATLRSPRRALRLLNPISRANAYDRLLRSRHSWVAEQRVQRRAYPSYQHYVAHQRSKLALKNDLDAYDQEYRAVLSERLQALDRDWRGTSVLCLAARIGTEVKAFIDQGAFAVGLDLNPGPGNAYVVLGDFHQLQYADHSLDVVFTNSLDHVYDLERMLCEVKRVLRPGGWFLAEVPQGRDTGHEPRAYESFWWDSVDDLVVLIGSQGFRTARRALFGLPWPGEQLCLLVADDEETQV